MGWNEEERNTKKGMELSTKILLSIIGCVILIIILISVLLINIKSNTFNIIVDSKLVSSTSKANLMSNFDNETYINIEEFAKIVGYEYHKGEYKTFTIEEDKCYVQGKEETASFYLNDNKVFKLPINKLKNEYEEFKVANTIKKQNEKLYASVEAIELAFNVIIKQTTNSFEVYTLDNLVSIYDQKVKKWGYTGLTELNFENKKAVKYGYLIVKKVDGFYKIIDDNNTKEIVSDKYNLIQFSENTKEFFVTNSLGQVGIINMDGSTKIEPTYDSIEILDKKSDLYLVKREEKFGVVKNGNITLIYPEYDSIGIDNKNFTQLKNQYLILDTLIPVCKNKKYGAFDKEGRLIYKVEYDDFGCNVKSVEVNDEKKNVDPVITIEKCKGVVVKVANKYGVLDLEGNVIVPISVDSIYEITKNDETNYYMIYNNTELNIIERLIKTGKIADETQNTITNVPNNTVNIINSTGIAENNLIMNQIQ